MIFTMLAVIVVATTLTLVMLRAKSTQKSTDASVDTLVMEEATQAGIDMALKKL